MNTDPTTNPHNTPRITRNRSQRHITPHRETRNTPQIEGNIQTPNIGGNIQAPNTEANKRHMQVRGQNRVNIPRLSDREGGQQLYTHPMPPLCYSDKSACIACSLRGEDVSVGYCGSRLGGKTPCITRLVHSGSPRYGGGVYKRLPKSTARSTWILSVLSVYPFSSPHPFDSVPYPEVESRE